VQLGIAVPARPVGVRRSDQAPAVDLLNAVPSAPGVHGVALDWA
jgi:hypothetical protein